VPRLALPPGSDTPFQGERTAALRLGSRTMSADLARHLQQLIRPGDTLWWGQATAEP
jgi:hypothetical protein